MKGERAQDVEARNDEDGEASPGKKLVRVVEPEKARNKAKEVMEAIAREVEKNQAAPGLIVAGGLNEAKAYVKASVAEGRELGRGQESARVRVMDPRQAETVKLDPRRIAKLLGEAQSGAEDSDGEDLSEGRAKETPRRGVDFLWILAAVAVGAGLVGAALYVGSRSGQRVHVALPLAIPVPVLMSAPAGAVERVETAEPEVGSAVSAAPALSVSGRVPKPARPGLGEEIFQ